MKAYTELVTEVMQDCQQAPEPLVARVARNVVIDFCERTLTIRRDLTAITIEPNTESYVLTPPENTSIIEVMNAQINDLDPLVSASQQQLDLWWKTPNSFPSHFNCWSVDDPTLNVGDSWRQFTQAIPRCYYIDKDSSDYRIRLVGIPTDLIADALVCKVALKPSRTSTSIDDWFIEDHYLRLINGVKAQMLMIPKRPWTDNALASFYKTTFEDDVDKQTKKALRDYVRDDESTGRVRAWY